MKLKWLHQHYTTKDKGKTWIPKKSFKSEDEIHSKLGYTISLATIYRCEVCSNLHIMDRNKVKSRKRNHDDR